MGEAETGLLRLHHFHFYAFITDLDLMKAFKLLRAALKNSTGALKPKNAL